MLSPPILIHRTALKFNSILIFNFELNIIRYPILIHCEYDLVIPLSNNAPRILTETHETHFFGSI